MGNHQSSDRDTVIQNLWKAQGAIPIVPLNPYLDALGIITKHSNGYQDVGNVLSLSKPGQDQEWLQQVLSPRKQKHYFSTKSMGQQSYTISDNHGAVAAKLTDGAPWFVNATSIEVRIPECWVREYDMENWGDMVRKFNPDMQKVNSMLRNPNQSSERELFILQKVVLVSHITITATYSTSAGPDVRSPVVLASGVQIKPRKLGRGTVEFTISNSAKKNQKLPIAFSGYKYTYDKFGDLKSKSRTQTDTAGASSSHGDDDEDDEDEDEEDEDEAEDDEEDVPVRDDANMGGFFLDDGDWCAQIVTEYDPTDNEIFDKCDEGDRSPPPGPPAG